MMTKTGVQLSEGKNIYDKCVEPPVRNMLVDSSI